MKNQYFGDINDYRKYGLLRALSNQGQIKTMVCWMLTPDDGRSDGQKTAYLQQTDRWRAYDPDLFDALQRCLASPGNRDVRRAETQGSLPGILPSTLLFSTMLTDDAQERQKYFQELFRTAQGCDLLFFDPDNGLEVKSKPYGRKDSCKYLYWRELAEAYAAGHSVLVYQHFPRVQRDAYVADRSARIYAETGASAVISFRTAHVVFLLVPQAGDVGFLRARSEAVASRWASQVEVDGLSV